MFEDQKDLNFSFFFFHIEETETQNIHEIQNLMGNTKQMFFLGTF